MQTDTDIQIHRCKIYNENETVITRTNATDDEMKKTTKIKQ